MTHSAEIDTPVEGEVKWFDPARGFGFVVVDGLERDVLLHMNVLRAFGQGSVADGSRITMRVQAGERGFQASEILAVEAGAQEEIPAIAAPSEQGDLPYEAARVKWFDKAKGFGFVNIFGSAEDIFVHADVLRRYGLAELGPGEAICIRAGEGTRGRLAVEVRRWEDYVL